MALVGRPTFIILRKHTVSSPATSVRASYANTAVLRETLRQPGHGFSTKHGLGPVASVNQSLVQRRILPRPYPIRLHSSTALITVHPKRVIPDPHWLFYAARISFLLFFGVGIYGIYATIPYREEVPLTGGKRFAGFAKKNQSWYRDREQWTIEGKRLHERSLRAHQSIDSDPELTQTVTRVLRKLVCSAGQEHICWRVMINNCFDVPAFLDVPCTTKADIEILKKGRWGDIVLPKRRS